MTHVACLISNPTARALDDRLLARVWSVLPAPDHPEWLAPDVAADIAINPAEADTAELTEMVRAALGEAPVDVAILPTRGRRKKLLLADMDSTMIGQECVDELADLVGLREAVGKITERAMNGEIAFEPALRERVALLAGLPLSEIERLLRERITLMPGGGTLVRTMRANGAYTALVSGGFTLFTGPIAERIGFDEHRGNVLDLAGTKLVGTVAEPVLGRLAKRQTLIELRERLGLSPSETMAVGDGANDLDMLSEAGLGVAFRAKPAVAAAAQVRVIHGDLTALLYLQGYRQDEFAP